jgi:hypothetical protein
MKVLEHAVQLIGHILHKPAPSTNLPIAQAEQLLEVEELHNKQLLAGRQQLF